ncbi:MAG TPA: ABC transporter permease [Chitinophagaceae bacterium]|jgi:putative ABC transport system permease protein|nr:ABC transporter permease [Chitinophagaceae bacterium]
MIKNYFKTAWRNILRNRTFTILNVSGLAIGVVVCLLIGVWLQRELSFDDFHPNGNRIFRLVNTFKSESESFSQAPSGPAFGAHLPKQLSTVTSACRLFGDQYKVKSGEQQFFESNIVHADPNFFEFFGFELKKGEPKTCLQSFDQAVLTEKLALKYFGKEDPLGKSIMIDNTPVTITGVAKDPPVNSHIQFDMLLSSEFLKKRMKDRYNFDIDSLWVGGWPNVYVQLSDPTSWKDAENQINQVAFKFEEKDWKENKMSYQYYLQPVRDIHLKSHLRYDASNNGSLARVNIFSIIGIIVLLLACINYINLTTAGAIKRAKETSVRKVIGATKPQLIRQFFSETFIICTLAVCSGVIIFKIILPQFSTWIGQTYYFPLNTVNILLLLGFVIFISTVAGIYPSGILSSFNPAVSLKGNFSQSRKGNMIRKTLVVFQFTITIALVASILIITQQMNFIKNRSLGFNGNAVIQVEFNGDENVLRQYSSIRNELLKSPYILNVSKHGSNVVGGLGNGWTTTVNLKGEEISTSLYGMSVDADYFKTYDMKLAAGRFFSKDIPTDTTKALLVNEAAVKTFGWQNPENAIGKPFGKGDETQYVVGVVKDFNFESLHKPVEALRIGYATRGSRISLKVDAAHINQAIAQLKTTWKDLASAVPLQYNFIEDEIAKQYGNEQKMEGIFYGFAALSLVIACLGLFGLSTFVVQRKTKEIGIRKVLGANIPGIVGLLSKDFLKLVLISMVIATPLAWYFMNNWLQDFAYRIHVHWWVFVAAGIIAIFIALITVSIQSIKAAIVNPVKSLRTE